MGRAFWSAVAAIIGTTIGAGVLALPYAFSQSGYAFGMLNLIIAGGASTFMSLYVGEVALRTKKVSQLSGLAGKYLGANAKKFMFGLQALSIYAALMAYLIGIGVSVSNLIGGPQMFYSTIFFFVFAPIVYFGLKAVEASEALLSGVKVLMAIGLSLILFSSFKPENLLFMDSSKALFPYGASLFACLSFSLIPNIERIMDKKKRDMGKAIVVGMALCVCIYALFTTSFIGAFGKNVQEIATASFDEGWLKVVADLFALVTLTTPFITLSWILKDIFIYDYGWPRPWPWVFAVFPPLLIVLLINPSFIQAVLVSGAYAGSLAGIMICLITLQARKKGEEKPDYVVPWGRKPMAALIVVFLVGMAYTTLQLLGLL
ncbi:MAG: amino acid permease [Nanoarchaeota archaeon]|nr:amino acid permease [Nanoarchaeota archaeon]